MINFLHLRWLYLSKSMLWVTSKNEMLLHHHREIDKILKSYVTIDEEGNRIHKRTKRTEYISGLL